ncbi:glycine cleavage system aminomethyltransferase GcvT [Roseibacterium sp. SDUM158017]|uniref:glycine cleavage system aminomethyltransferase GcvT n=1 Tax=Roseicyclus salinarum TaxID=3036773 RepID=UPI002415054B|nr:glycine cleavage system aminomethyltransferase GcvT [Roseibacterium sp. SDUM158017]MDG4647951.1 glycine cleavage system aminomethyltransferase GcvT [Roseibacterium sp. SDUM158017]
MAGTSHATDDLKTLPLRALHEEHGATFVPFAGWEMPVRYAAGVMAEHLWCREKAGLFDVSHMGQVMLPHGADEALEALVPMDVVGLKEGRQRYAYFTNAAGGLLDDLMIARHDDGLHLVVNAACAEADIAHLRAHAPGVEVLEGLALLALQGPMAEAALAGLLPEVAAMRFMDVRRLTWEGAVLRVSRSGYTGEDGFEISVPAGMVEAFARALLSDGRVAPIGLGARDSLRLEAGLPLYGQDLGPDITPVEAGLGWAIQKVRRRGGAREGGFPGADVILRQIETGAPRRRAGLLPEGRAPMRAGTPLFDALEGGAQVGEVTSGGFGPSVGAPVAIALLDAEVPSDVTLHGEVRGRRLPARQAATPFVPPGYKR